MFEIESVKPRLCFEVRTKKGLRLLKNIDGDWEILNYNGKYIDANSYKDELEFAVKKYMKENRIIQYTTHTIKDTQSICYPTKNV